VTDLQCAILAGGLATRLRPVTDTIPKALVPVAGRPFVDHQLAWLARDGVTDVVFCIGHLGDRIAEHVGDGSAHGLRVSYVDEGSDLRGTGGALRLAYDEGALAPVFAVLYGDSYLAVDVAQVRREFDEHEAPALMTVFRNEGRFDASNARLEDGWVVRYEKGLADPAAAGMHYIDYGLSILDRDAVLADVPPGAVADLATLYTRLAAERRLAGREVAERFYEVGSPSGLAELEAHLFAEARR
jgi:NDP-sugar pyrophosphorylase family protein